MIITGVSPVKMPYGHYTQITVIQMTMGVQATATVDRMNPIDTVTISEEAKIAAAKLAHEKETVVQAVTNVEPQQAIQCNARNQKALELTSASFFANIRSCRSG